MSEACGGKLRKRDKLMEKTEYTRVLGKGTRLSSQNFSASVLGNGLGFPRVGHVVAKKTVSSAVLRNRIKRRFREIFRLNKQKFGSNDVVFIAKTDSSNLPFQTVSREILGMVSGEENPHG
ncbi:MAG: ribonuclease P protein component [Thermodesulfobacteriota bacterium]